MKRSLILFLSLFVICNLAIAANPKFVVVIDAGHGGKDGGAARGTYKEKNINLGVALALGQFIERNMKDVKVIYTRKTDVFVELDQRAKIANKEKANLFISVHTNSTAAIKENASGADTYILGLTRSAENLAVAKRENSVILLEDNYSSKYEGFDPNSPESNIIFEFMTNKYMEQSLQLATNIQFDFRRTAKRQDRGVRQAGFLVLRKTSMPSVLIELGFINNPSEAQFLSSKAGQSKMAAAIYSGFKKYKLNFDKMQGKNSIAAPSSDETEDDLLMVDEDIVTDVDTTPVRSKAKKSDAKLVKKEEKKGKIEYRVQFLYSDTKLPKNSPKLKGLSPVSFYQEGAGYKYTFGSTTDLNKIVEIQKQVKQKFKDAFVIKFKNDKRIK